MTVYAYYIDITVLLAESSKLCQRVPRFSRLLLVGGNIIEQAIVCMAAWL